MRSDQRSKSISGTTEPVMLVYHCLRACLSYRRNVSPSNFCSMVLEGWEEKVGRVIIQEKTNKRSRGPFRFFSTFFFSTCLYSSAALAPNCRRKIIYYFMKVTLTEYFQQNTLAKFSFTTFKNHYAKVIPVRVSHPLGFSRAQHVVYCSP